MNKKNYKNSGFMMGWQTKDTIWQKPCKNCGQRKKFCECWNFEPKKYY